MMGTDTKTYTHPKPCGAAAKNIAAFAEAIGKALNFKPGMDLEPIVRRLKGKIEYLPLASEGSQKASITVEKGGKFKIGLSAALFPLQKRISIAHELGHLFLHSRYGEVSIEACHGLNPESEEEAEVEDEAHEFACAFLMPAEIVRKATLALGNNSTKVAAHFMVPEPVARQRMEDVRQG